MKLEIKYGLILFGIAIIPTLGFLFFDMNPLSGPVMWGSMLVTFIFLVFAGIQKRKSLGGYMDFGQAFKTIFLVALISSIPSAFVGYFTLIDNPKADALMQEYGKSSGDWIAGMQSKITGESKEEILLKMEQENENLGSEKPSFGIGTMLFGSILNSLLYALVLSVFVKKKPKVT